ncbi:GGDEF domain-containing protein [Candidatus Woesearchaeota archaeon]|nr:GGDEF domain-containing protein [Candidatus Woesearchaeota archaeon]
MSEDKVPNGLEDAVKAGIPSGVPYTAPETDVTTLLAELRERHAHKANVVRELSLGRGLYENLPHDTLAFLMTEAWVDLILIKDSIYWLTHDPETGSANKAGLDEALELVKRVRPQGLYVMYTDVDDMTKNNEKYGHPAMNEGLKARGIAMSNMLRRCEDYLVIFARPHGDEGIALFQAPDHPAAISFGNRLRIVGQEALTNGVAEYLSKNIRPITISAGIAWVHPENIPHAIEEADQAVHHSKRNGKNQITASPEMTE